MTLRPRVADLGSFDLLVSVAELGSIGAAARRHGVSQPAVSARLRALEASVGLALLERSSRGATLTEAGGLVVDWARPAVHAATSLEEGLCALRAEAESRLRVAASTTVAEYLLPGWLVALRAAMPDTTVALTSHNSTDTVGDVRRGDADLGFVEGPEAPPGMASRIVARDRLSLVVGPGHPWARRRGVDPGLLAATALVVREQGSGTRRVLDRALRAAGHDLVAPVLELGSTTAIKNAVAEGVAPAVLSSLVITAELAAGSLVAIPVRGVALDRELRAIHREGRLLSPPAERLLAIAGRRSPRSRPVRPSAPG